MPRLPPCTDLNGTAELEAVDKAIGVFKKHIQWLAPDQQKALNGLLDQLIQTRDKFAVEAPKANARLQSMKANNKKNFEEIIASFEARIEAVKQRRAALEDMKKKDAEEMAKKEKPKKVPARPSKIPEKKTEPLEFTNGDLLSKWLMASPPPPLAAPKGGFPRTSGNIWENWTPVRPPARETEGDDLEEFDPEEEDTN
jgi:hypothetical protein